MNQHDNIDAGEIARFSAMADIWWDRNGEFKALHDINPVRLAYVCDRVDLNGKQVLDVGCGGGLLSEGLAAAGGRVTGIDMVEASLMLARAHTRTGGLRIDYRQTTAENLAEIEPGRYDVVVCMELLEHVPDPSSVIRACYQLVKPGGKVFFSTLNRNPKSYLFAIIGAEYRLRMMPRGTNDYGKFIRPSELERWARGAGLQLRELTGMTYNPLGAEYRLGDDVDVNYLAWFSKPA